MKFAVMNSKHLWVYWEQRMSKKWMISEIKNYMCTLIWENFSQNVFSQTFSSKYYLIDLKYIFGFQVLTTEILKEVKK